MPYSSKEKRKAWTKQWETENTMISIRKRTKIALQNVELGRMGDSYDSLINKLIKYYRENEGITRFTNKKIEQDDEEEDYESDLEQERV
ncbi:MAG: hypothetical protein JW840_02970 [Candidatus Thermoplasmatota archaeon]|nr:hypothetical protein [Candidatus Thermoplasmatota archaeon]